MTLNFALSFAMSGGVSAGCFTAGVMDFILQALYEWQLERANNPNQPYKHNIIIPAMAGTSAGGITALLTAAQMRGGWPENIAQNDYFSDRLYQTWVVQSQFDGENGLSAQGDEGESLLNNQLIRRNAQQYLSPLWGENSQQTPYLANELAVIVPVANYQGYNEKIAFSGRQFTLTNHRDYYYFAFKHNGALEWPKNGFYNGLSPSNINAENIINATCATSAMPLVFPSIIKDGQAVCDGGIVNNHPFSFAHDIITPIGQNQNPRTAAEVSRAVIMINPLPQEPSDNRQMGQKLSLGIIGQLIVMGMQNSVIESENWKLALDESIYSRYLLSPSEELPIISDKLGGFAGFLNQQWRHHDFMVGRLYAQEFLQNTLTLPADCGNPIIPAGYVGENYPLIPLFGPCTQPIKIPTIAKLSEKDWQKITNAMQARAEFIWQQQTQNAGFLANIGLFMLKHIIFTILQKIYLPKMAKMLKSLQLMD